MWILLLLLSVSVFSFWYWFYPPHSVLPKENREEARTLLQSLASRATLLIDNLEECDIKDRLKRRWNPNHLHEGSYHIKGISSYTVDKGKKVVMCLRDQDGDLYDQDLLLYVLLHELAHIACESSDHNEEFLTAFEYLLQQAIHHGIYAPQKRKNDSYCHNRISSLP
jgi:hypothetical protein